MSQPERVGQSDDWRDDAEAQALIDAIHGDEQPIPAGGYSVCEHGVPSYRGPCPECKPPSPWGHKVVMVVYVEGEQAKAEMAAECIAGQVMVPNADFIGMSIEAVQERPTDQGGS